MAVAHRIFLIRNQRSRNNITFEQCTMEREKICNLSSDRQMANYIASQAHIMLSIIPANNHKAILQYRALMEEAKQIINQGKKQIPDNNNS